MRVIQLEMTSWQELIENWGKSRFTVHIHSRMLASKGFLFKRQHPHQD